MTAELDFDGATVTQASFYRSLIRSDARLTYPEVDDVFAGRERARSRGRAARRRPRGRRGAGGAPGGAGRAGGHLDRAGLRLRQAHGHVTAVEPDAQTESHRLIEHLMIAANEAVAGLLEDRKLPALYRVHERPGHRARRAPRRPARVPRRRRPGALARRCRRSRRSTRSATSRAPSRRSASRASRSLVLRALKQAVLLAGQRRPRRAALAALLPLHLAHPPLSGPRRAPRAARGARGGGGRRPTGTRARGAGHVVLAAASATR